VIIAHLPAGYLLHRTLTRHEQTARGLLWVSLLGSVFPDADLLYFYGPGHRHVLHHRYWTHLPAAWLAIGVVLWLLCRNERLEWLRWPSLLFLSNVALHLLLDTTVGGIYWAWPFSWHVFRVWSVRARYQPYLMNFVCDWTFLPEIAICVAAARVLWAELRTRKGASSPRSTPSVGASPAESGVAAQKMV
jgi:inner membrane protein